MKRRDFLRSTNIFTPPPPGTGRQAFLLLALVIGLGAAMFLAIGPAPPTAAHFYAAPSSPQAVINACGAIMTTTTWTTGNVYTASNCYVSVAAGVTLTIEPGVIVKFGGACPSHGCGAGSVALQVNGTLIASGTAAQPVVFTSLADDAHGGDTNGDGPSAGAAGQWYGLVFMAGSRGELTHTRVSYAGPYVFNANLGYGRAQVDARGGDLQLRYSTVITGAQVGIYLEGNGITPVIQDVYIAGNRKTDGKGYAIYQDSINMQPTYSNLTLSGNDQDQVIIGRANEALSQNVTLGGADFGFRCGFTLCQLTVPNSITLTVAPGTLLNFGPSYGIAVADGGALIAEGTVTQPITFTSQLAASGTPNQQWMGLWAKKGSKLRLDQCDISYASNGNFGNGGLEISTADAQVRNCHIHHNRDDGLHITGSAGVALEPRLENVEISDNGRYGVHLYTTGSSLAPTFEGGAISRNGWAGVYSNVWDGSPVNLTLRNLTVSANGSAAAATGADRAGMRLGHGAISPVLENLTLTGNAGAAIYWNCNGSITARNLTVSGNGVDELTLPGCTVGGGRQWDLGDAGIPTRVTGNIEVTTGGLLSILPGTTLRFDKNKYGSPTYLTVRDQAALYALGTAERPIIFTGATQTRGWWAGIQAYQRSSLVLRHCEIGYGGAVTGTDVQSSLYIKWGWPNVGVPSANIQNCEIHNSGKKGVHFDFGNYSPVTSPPIFHYNNLHDNTEEAVANWNAPPLDARKNYWGDPTGPYHLTQNPGGQGDAVGNNILFYPWLGAPATGGEAPGEMLISTGAPSLVSPGQTTDYAIQYLNLMTTTVENAVVMIQLPQAAEYVDSTGGGAYWPERHQVFWKLGDLPPNAEGFVSTRVRFQWGLPADYKDGAITLLAADNYNAGQFAVDEYTAYQPVTVAAQVTVSQAEFKALRAASADLQTLYAQAIAQGYVYLEAGRTDFSDGTAVTGAVFRTPDRRSVRLLTLYEGSAMAVTNGDGLYTLHDTTGGMTTTLNGLSRSYWGDWASDAGAQTLGATAPTACTSARCKFNCIGKKVTFKYVTYSLGKMFMWTIATGGGGGLASGAYHALHVTKMIYDCNNECNNDPNSNCCTAGQVRWTPSGWFKLFGSACVKEVCNGTTGTYGSPGTIYCTAGGQRCVAGYGAAGGCKDCSESAGLYSEVTLAPQSACAVSGAPKPKCSDLELLRAKDPNAIYGPEGDLLPGQLLTYTITYENEGAGRAYGVYVINELPAVFNQSTLNLYGKGVYQPETRELIWLVGELGPKGALDSEGAITYTVRLQSGLPSGTVVSNEAVVYFPSVPEETPTNVWVNLVAPLAAIPQTLYTDYGMPLTITLAGREISSLPLMFEIVDWPLGALTGTLPTLVYTPTENFVGVDDFTFRVSNGITTSRSAQVRINVSPTGDTDPPQVLWVSPSNDAQDVPVPTTPVYTDTLGPVYAPVIVVGFSEVLSASSVTTQTVWLVSATGQVTGTVAFDGLLNQATLAPRAPLQSETIYTVMLESAIADLAGNPLGMSYKWNFTTAGPGWRYVYLPLVLRNN